MTSDLRAEVEIWSFRACVMHPVIIIGTVRDKKTTGSDKWRSVNVSIHT